MRTLILSVIIFASNVCLKGQTAQVSGLIRDVSLALVPDATVTVVSETSGFRRETASNAEGLFTIPFLPPGKYTIQATARGLQSSRQTGVTLDIGQSARLDFVLQPGALEQSITVKSDSTLVRTDQSGVSTVINREFIDTLPLNGRSFQSLIALTPGVVLTQATFGEQGQFSVNGQRANANYFTIDGVSANIGVSAGLTLVQSASGSLPGLGASGGTNTLVSVEALEEFRVQTSSYTAEFGRMPGAQITILTRSGTNKLHGSVFNFFRNDALDATDWFANAQSLPKPELRQNDFGGVLGGPIKRDQTFFFVSYEGLRLRQPQVLSTDVPIIDYRTTYACRLCKPFLNAFPLPNRTTMRLGLSPFVASFTNPSSLDAGSLRIDHRLGTKVTLFGRYNQAPSGNTSRSTEMLSNPIDTTVGTKTLTVGATALFTPRLVSDSRFNFSSTTGYSSGRLDNFGGAVPFDPQLFFPQGVDVANAFGGYFMNGGINSGFYLGKNVANSQRQWNLTDTVSYTLGSHQLKFGADWRHVVTENNPRAYDLFAYFVGVFGAATGQTSQTTVGAQEDLTVFLNNISLFAQDTWKVTPKLTLNLGLRWELNPAPDGSKPLYSYVPTEDPRQITVAPAGTPLYHTRYNGFAPRLGAAYQLSRSTTFRAGFGLFYDLGGGLMAQAAAGFPYFRQLNIVRGTAWPVPASISAPLPFTLNPPIASIYGAAPGFSLPVTYQWNVAVEQMLNRSNALSVSYVGAAGRDLLRQNFYVNPTDSITYAYLLNNAAFSDFHSLQVQYQRKLTRGVQALVSYTFAKSLDNASNESYAYLKAPIIDPKDDRGPSDFDIRQALSGAFSANLPTKWLKGWGLDGVYLYRTAAPVDVTYSLDNGFGVYNFRPDLVRSPVYLSDPNVGGGRRFNADAFEIPFEYPGRQGTLGRNALRGFGFSQINFTVRREFRVYEELKLQFRAELFNATNTPSFGAPSGSLQSPQFGYSTSMLGQTLGRGGVNGGLNPLYQVGGPRSIQLSLRLAF